MLDILSMQKIRSYLKYIKEEFISSKVPNRPNVSLISFMWQYLKSMSLKYKIVLIVILISSIVSTVVNTSAIVLIATTIERVIAGETAAPRLPYIGDLYMLLEDLGIQIQTRTLLGITAVLVVFQIVLNTATRLYSSYFVSQYALETRNDLYKRMMDSHWIFFINNDTGTLLNSFNNLTNKYAGFFGTYNSIFSFVFSIIVYTTPLLIISWQLSLIAASTLVFILPVTTFLNRYSRKMGLRITNVQKQLTSEISKYYSLTKTVKGTGGEQQSISDIRSTTEKSRVLSLRLNYVRSAVGIIRALFSLGLLIGGAAVSVLLLNLDGVVVLSSVLLLQRVYGSLSRIGPLTQSIYLNIDAAQQFIDIKNEATQGKENLEGKSVKPIEHSIKLENVSFSYPDGTEVLHNINIEIPKGKFITFVGESGSGKTTTLDILTSLLKPTSGRMLVDGKDITDYNPRSWRNLISYVPQGFPIFRDTVRNNLSWGIKNVTDKDIERVTSLAKLDFIDSLKHGYDTEVGGTQGIGISGGQRQRLAIAKAFIRQSNLMILDEATSEMDVSTEEYIYRKITEVVRQGSTIVSAAHRLVTTTNADIIFVFDKGRVVESGSPKELIQKKGVYYKFWQKALNVDKETMALLGKDVE